MNEYSKVSVKYINLTHRNTLYSNTLEISEREIKETISFTITTKIIKHTGINLPKEQKSCM